ncbi:MAG: M48 family metalloprotease [Gammaproteobacteria bacterium]
MIDPIVVRCRPQTAAVLALLLLLAGCATNPVTGRQDLVFMSEQQEVALGAQAHAEILQRYQVYDDPALQRYVDAIGQSLATHSHRSQLTYRFTVLDSTEINAFALPGGYVYITRGLLAYLNSEAELAAVLGHEIGHVTARHSVRQQSSAQAASVGAGLLSVLVPQLGYAGLNQTINLLGTALLRGYGREMELEADGLGAEYLARTGYDPQAMIAVIGTLKNQEIFDRELAAAEGREPRAYHGLFATHPSNDQRLREAVAHAAQAGQAVGGEIRRDAFLDRIDGLVIGENPQEGVVRGKHYHHAALGFALDLPDGWAVENLPDRLVLSAPQGAAQIQLTAKRLDTGQTVGSLVHGLRLASFADEQTLSVNGLKGLTGVTQIAVEGRQLPARLVAIGHGGRAFLVTGAAREAAGFAQIEPVVLATARSFRPLTEVDRKKVSANRLHVVPRRNAVSWAALAANSPLRKLPEAQLRLLNAAPPTSPGPETPRYKVVD